MAHTGEPFRVQGLAMVDGIEHEFDAGRNAQLIEDTEQVFLYGVFAEVEFAGSVTVTEAFGNEGNNLFLARGKQLVASGVEHAQRRYFGDKVEQESHLLGVGPDLTIGDPLDAAAQKPEVRIRNAENTASAGAKSAGHEVAIVGFNQQNLGDLRVQKVNTAHRGHLVGDVDGVIQRENHYFGRSGGHCLKN